jgi:Transposase DDE domain
LAVVEQAHARQLLSEEHFTVDGTLIQAWANRRSFKEKQDPPERGTGARGRKLLRDTHESSSDPEARLYKKSGAASAVPSYLGPVLIENRHGLVVQAMATQASTRAEREAALTLLDRMHRRPESITLGADKGDHEETFVEQLRARRVAPHVAEYVPNPKWPSFLTEAERNDPGFAISQRKRKLVEKIFGWGKLDRALSQIKLRGLRRVNWLVQLVATAHNLRRMQTLLAAG